MTALYLDADACPVKAEALKVAERLGVRVLVVSNGGIRPSPHPLVETVIVAQGPDAADDWIAERAGPGDVVVTGDIPLAARCLAAGARALRHDGSAFDARNIGEALATRALLADLRGANPLAGGGGGKPFGRAERSRFLDALDRTLRAALRGG
jgi:uncharacterized protein YaiI (UPF0178 family)